MLQDLPLCIDSLIYLKHSRSRLPNHETYAACVAGKKGLEIGGPSMLFKTTLPLYQIIKDLDGVNFSTHTAWEGSIKAGRHFNFIGAKKGMQFIAEASDLTALQDQSYEFLLSSNCLEHVANPIKALMEWKRVIQNLVMLFHFSSPVLTYMDSIKARIKLRPNVSGTKSQW